MERQPFYAWMMFFLIFHYFLNDFTFSLLYIEWNRVKENYKNGRKNSLISKNNWSKKSFFNWIAWQIRNCWWDRIITRTWDLILSLVWTFIMSYSDLKYYYVKPLDDLFVGDLYYPGPGNFSRTSKVLLVSLPSPILWNCSLYLGTGS